MKEVLWLVVHCTATKPNVQVTVEDLDRMHAARGWARCGYHWVIQPDGTIGVAATLVYSDQTQFVGMECVRCFNIVKV